MKKILLLLAMMAIAMGADALTLEECVLRGSSPRGIGAMQPSKSDGRYFYRLSDDGNAINRISYAKGDESVDGRRCLRAAVEQQPGNLSLQLQRRLLCL